MNNHLTALGELERIANQVVQNLLQPVEVRQHGRQGQINGIHQRQALTLRLVVVQLQHLFHHHGQGAGAQGQIDRLVLQFGKVQQIVHQIGQTVTAGGDRV